MDKEQIIYGRLPVLESIQRGVSLQKVWVAQNLSGDYEKELRNICKDLEIPYLRVPPTLFNKATRKNHQGVIGWMSPVEYAKVADVLPLIYERGETPFFLILDGIVDVGNLGAIARSAAAFGVHALVLPSKNTALVTEDAIKASAGVLSTFPVCREKSLDQTLELMAVSGMRTYGLDGEADIGLSGCPFQEPTAIVLGSEEKGIRPHLKRKVDKLVRIPQSAAIDSLNASVAAGIALYEVFKARSTGSGKSESGL